MFTCTGSLFPNPFPHNLRRTSCDTTIQGHIFRKEQNIVPNLAPNVHSGSKNISMTENKKTYTMFGRKQFAKCLDVNLLTKESEKSVSFQVYHVKVVWKAMELKEIINLELFWPSSTGQFSLYILIWV